MENALNTHNKEEYPPMHTCEHILNGTIVRMFGCPRAFTTHIERKKSKIDLHCDRAPTPEELRRIEETVNEVIARELDVTEEIVSRTEAADLYDLSRLPEEAGESLRIVHVGDYDACPCIGQHVSNTREIPPMRIVSADWNEGVLRVRFKFRT